MVAVVAYFTAEDELSANRLTRQLRAADWVVEWMEEGPEGWMLRAVQRVGFDSRRDAQTTAEALADSSGAVCNGTELEPASELGTLSLGGS